MTWSIFKFLKTLKTKKATKIYRVDLGLWESIYLRNLGLLGSLIWRIVVGCRIVWWWVPVVGTKKLKPLKLTLSLTIYFNKVFGSSTGPGIISKS